MCDQAVVSQCASKANNTFTILRACYPILCTVQTHIAVPNTQYTQTRHLPSALRVESHLDVGDI
jgi:hypothetical protein